MSSFVVDNGSDDDSEELLASLWPDLRLIQTGSNLGYAGGNNWGIRHALEPADYVWVLNNDTVVEPGTLSEAVAAMEARPAVGAVATRLVELESGRTAEDAFTTDGHTMSPVLCDGCDLGWHAAEVLGGPSLLLRAAALREVGLFDEEYFHYYEEADLMERMRRSGWEVGLACRAPIHHEHGQARSPTRHRSRSTTSFAMPCSTGASSSASIRCTSSRGIRGWFATPSARATPCGGAKRARAERRCSRSSTRHATGPGRATSGATIKGSSRA